MSRSRAETKRIIKRMTFVRRLLKENGLILSGYDPGVLALKKVGKNPFTKEWHTVSLNFERAEWGWLEPLLLELRRLRRIARSSKTRHDG